MASGANSNVTNANNITLNNANNAPLLPPSVDKSVGRPRTTQINVMAINTYKIKKIMVNLDENVVVLKEIIQDEFGIPSQFQQLFLPGAHPINPRWPEKTNLRYYKITEDTIIQVNDMRKGKVGGKRGKKTRARRSTRRNRK